MMRWVILTLLLTLLIIGGCQTQSSTEDKTADATDKQSSVQESTVDEMNIASIDGTEEEIPSAESDIDEVSALMDDW